ncbi:hypothetical protein [Pseudoalteromonas phage vB_PtuP_Slicky01]|nr:hypothetical protein [Pseudoalteromonas phage vB_PtuP_Slicky01]
MAQLLNLRDPGTETSSHLCASTCKVGIEVEVESNNDSRNLHELANWNNVREDSVNGFELVLREPKGGFNLVTALDELEEALTPLVNRSSAANVFSPRTSVHVHINITDMTQVQFLNFITLAIMFEKVLYNYVEPHRSKNHFCLPSSDAAVMLAKLSKLARSIAASSVNNNSNSDSQLRNNYVNMFGTNSFKYGGINLASVHAYGSLEFRMHHGTHLSSDILRWVNILQSLKSYAMLPDKTPSNILDTKKEIGISDIFRQVLGVYSDILKYEGIEGDILSGIRNAQDIVGAYNRGIRSIPDRILPPMINRSYFDAYVARFPVESADNEDDDDDDDDVPEGEE